MTHSQTWKSIIDYLKAGWSLLGPLVGVLVGAWLARSWDKQKWLSDNRKQECRELLTAVTHAATAILDRDTGTDVLSQMRKQALANDAYLISLKVFQDRIFIAGDVERAKLFDMWPVAVNRYNSTKDRNEFDDCFEQKIVQIAIGTSR